MSSRRVVTKAIMAIGLFGVLLGAVGTLVPSQPAIAAVNRTINFQGKVVNSNGTNVADGSYGFVFKMYNVSSAGSALWTETKTLTVTDGVFQTNLGDVTTMIGLVDFNSSTNYLGINFNSDGEMSPRILFTAAPYALNSDLLDGLDSSAFAQLSPGSAQSGSLNVTGSVQAATSLQAPLVDTATAVALGIGTGTASSVTVGRATSATNLTLQGSASTSWSATSASGSTTVSFVSPTTTNTIRFQNAGGDVCTTVASTCSTTYQVASTTGYLFKNAIDTSSASVAAAGNLYTFTNSNGTPATGGVLKLDNGANTGSTLLVTASGNPAASNALIVANNTAGSPSGNLLDLQVSGVSKLAVDTAGNVTQTGGTATTDTINGQRISAAANFTGTVTAATGLTVSAGGFAVTGNSTLAGSLAVTYAGTSGTGSTTAVTNSGASGTNSVKGAAINLTSTSTSGTNNTTGLDFGSVTNPGGTNNFYGINFGTGMTDLMRYNSTQLISGLGILQNAAIGSGVNYTNLTQVGALTSGSIASFGTISTGNTITTTAAIQGGTGTFTGASGLTLGTSSSNTGAIVLKGSGGTGTLTLQGPTTPNAGNYTLSIPAITGNANVCTDNSVCTGYAPASGSTSYIQNTTTVQTNANIAISSAADASVTLLLKQRPTQSADVLRITDSSNALIFDIDTFGALHQAFKATIDGAVGIGIGSSGGEQLRIAAASTSTIGLSIYANTGQTADLINVDGDGTRALNYTGTGTLAVTAGSGQAVDLLQLKDTGGGVLAKISSSGALTAGTGTFTGASALTLGTASTTTGSIVFKGSGGAGTLTLQGPATPNASNYTLSIPAITANANVCTDNAVCTGYLASSAAIIQVPGTTAQNTIAPIAANVVALTVKGTIGTAAHVLDIYNSAGSPTLQDYFDSSGSLNVSQAIQPTSNNAIDLGLSGTAFRSGYFGTSLQAPLVSTANVASGTSADIVVRSGNGTAGGASSGNVTVDSGSKNAGGFSGNVYIGNTNALNVSVGRNGGTGNNSALTLMGTASSSTLILSNSANTFQTTIGFTTPTATRTVTFADASGNVCLDTGNCSNAGGYIINGTSLQTASFNVNGTGGVGGNLTVGGTYNTNTLTSSALTFGAAAGATIQSAASQALTLSSHGTAVWGTDAGNLTIQASAASANLTLNSGAGGTIAIGNTDAAHTINIGAGGATTNQIVALGSSNTGSTTTIEGPTLSIGTANVAHSIGIGTASGSAQALILGSTNASTTVSVQAGGMLEQLTSTGLVVKSLNSNLSTALQIQNAAGANVAKIDTTDTNLIINPGADVALAGEWTAYGSNTTVSRDPSIAWNGTASLSTVVTPSTGTVGAKNALGATLSATTTYTLSFYAKLKSGDPSFSDISARYLRDGSTVDATCTGFNTQTVVSTGWTRIICTLATSSTLGNSSAAIAIYQGASAARTFYLDGVQLEQTNNVANAYGTGAIALDAVVTRPLAMQNTEDSTNAFTVQDAAGTTQFGIDTLNGKVSTSGLVLQNSFITPNSAMQIGSSGQNLLMQGNNTTKITATNGANTVTVGFAAISGSGTYNFASPSGAGPYTICTSDLASCGTSSTGYLRKGVANETSNANMVSASDLLYSFSNSGSAQSGILKLDNGAGTGSTLQVIAAANAVAGSALIYANNSLNNSSGNLLDLWSTQSASSASRFSVAGSGAVTAGTINGQTITSAASFSGTVATGGLLTANSLSVTNGATFNSGATVNAVALTANAGASVTGGINNNAGGITGAGAVSGLSSLQFNTAGSIDANSAVLLSIGTVNASGITIGKSTATQPTISLQGSVSSSFAATGASGATTLAFATLNATAKTVTIPNETGTICTSAASSNATCNNFAPASASGNYVQLTPAAAQSYNSANPGIFLNKQTATVTDKIMELQYNVADVFAVQGNGDVTVGGTSGKINTNTFNGSTLTFGTAGAATISSAASQALNVTGHANSVISTDAGSLTVTSAAAATWGTGAGALTVSGAAGTTITTANVSGAVTSAVSVISGNVTSGAFASGNATVDAGTSTGTTGTVGIGTANASGVSIGKSTTTTNVNGTTQIGTLNTAGTGALVNNGTTKNTTLAIANLDYSGSGNSGTIGVAGATVDLYTSFTINQTTASQTLTVPTPTVGAGASTGRVIYISNIGSQSFTLLTGGATMNPNSTATLVFNGVQWTFAGADGSSILNQNTAAQSASFWINGTGKVATSLLTPTVDALTTGALALGTGATSTSINMGGASLTGSINLTTNSSSSGVVVKSSTNSVTALTVQNANSEPVFAVDTTTSNLLKNSGFEPNSTTNWGLKGTSTVTADQTVANVYHGATSLKAIITAATSGMATTGGQAAFTSNIAASTQYQLTFFAKCSFGLGTLTIGRQDVSGTDVNVVTNGACTTNWQQFTAHWTTGATITNPNIYVTGGSATTPSIWIDAVSLVQTSTSAATNYDIGSQVVSGVFTNPAIFQNNANSPLAFQIQNASGSSLFSVDTINSVITASSQVVLGSSGNTATFGSTGEVTFAGTARHSKSIRLTAEYAGAVLDTGGQASVSGTMTAGYDATPRFGYYKWTTGLASAQTYDIVVSIPLPDDWAAWNGNPQIKDYASSIAAGNTINIINMTRTDGSADTTFAATPVNITPGSTSTWTTYSTKGLDATGYTAGGTMTIRIRMSSISSSDIRLGDIILPYFSRY